MWLSLIWFNKTKIKNKKLYFFMALEKNKRFSSACVHGPTTNGQSSAWDWWPTPVAAVTRFLTSPYTIFYDFRLEQGFPKPLFDPYECHRIFAALYCRDGGRSEKTCTMRVHFRASRFTFIIPQCYAQKILRNSLVSVSMLSCSSKVKFQSAKIPVKFRHRKLVLPFSEADDISKVRMKICSISMSKISFFLHFPHVSPLFTFVIRVAEMCSYIGCVLLCVCDHGPTCCDRLRNQY